MVKTSYAFWSWICLWRFFENIWKFPARKKFRPEAEISAEGRSPCRRQGSLLISLKKSILSGGPSRRQLYPSRWYFFQNRFKNIITFPKRHADNFLEIFPIVKTSYAFCSWICLWRFFDKIWEQECFFREQECFFFSKISKKKKKKKKKKISKIVLKK